MDTRFLFLTIGAADAAEVNAFMNPALSMATANNKKKTEVSTLSLDGGSKK